MRYRTIALEQRGPVALVTLARPEQGNRVNRLMVGELEDLCQAVDSDNAVHAVVITGTGLAFSLGWDAAEFFTGQDSGPSSSYSMIAGVSKPVIAAVNGPAISAGLELALACDIRTAADNAGFGLPEIESGFIPMGGGTQRLPRIVGRAKALEMVLTGRSLDADEAFKCGLVSSVSRDNELLPDALALAGRIAERGPLAVKYAKEAVHRGIEMPLEQALRYETDLTIILQTTNDRAEGVRAFLEKRAPRFEGT